ncbi:MAG: Hsp20/alpha crystallin family protein [Planctomycetota bacterium]
MIVERIRAPRPAASAEEPRLRIVRTPAVDMFETPQAVTILADMPGVAAERLAIDLREGVLTLRGEVDSPAAPSGSEARREDDPGTFYRQFRLSEAIDQERIEARLAAGVLRLELPKTKTATPRKIAVSTR